MTTYEFSLLRALAERAGRVLSREQILDLARGNAEEAFDRSIDVHVSRLRQKLESDPRHPHLLKTIRGPRLHARRRLKWEPWQGANPA